MLELPRPSARGSSGECGRHLKPFRAPGSAPSVALSGRQAGVLSFNIHRRHMTKGQRVMAVAKIYSEPEKGGRGNKRLHGRTVSGVPNARISEARTILAASTAMAADVIAGTLSLDSPYRPEVDGLARGASGPLAARLFWRDGQESAYSGSAYYRKIT